MDFINSLMNAGATVTGLHDSSPINETVTQNTLPDPSTINSTVAQNTLPDPSTINSTVAQNTLPDPSTINSTVAQNTSLDFDINSFNAFTKFLGKEFKDLNEAKDFFSIPHKYKELEDTHNLTKKEIDSLKTEYEKTKKEYQEVGKYVNPRDFFADDASFKANQLKLKYPDKDAITMDRISRMDIDKATKIDLILLNEKLKNPDIYEGYTDEQILQYLSNEKYKDIDLNDSENWDATTKIKISKDLKDIRNEFKTLQSIELPQKIDIEARKTELMAEQNQKYEIAKKGLQSFTDQVINKNPDISITDPDNPNVELFKFKPKVTDELKADLANFIDTLAKNGKDLSSDEVGFEIAKHREQWLIYHNLPEISKAISMKVATEKELAYHNKIHNDAPLSQKIAPQNTSVDDGTSAQLKEWLKLY
jgi:hypothetical protein